ncbi:MAG: hypothetical protein ACP5N2_02575 [Candidatus Nanoarchaeia archaeon]
MAKSTEVKRLKFNNGENSYNLLVKHPLNLATIIPAMEPSTQAMLQNFTRASHALDDTKSAYNQFENAEDSETAITSLNIMKQKINVAFSNFILPCEIGSNPVSMNMTYVFVILVQTGQMENNQKTKVYFDKLGDNYNTFFNLIDNCIKTPFPKNKELRDCKTLIDEIKRLETTISNARVLVGLVLKKKAA